jgi:lipopolysaccharide export system permease protein
MTFFELVRVFTLSLLGITGILVMAGVVAEASQQGLTPTQILAAIPLLVPSTCPYTIPATTLFATCVVYGRLAHDNEILAIKSAGINVMTVIWPAIVLGAAMSGATMYLYWQLIPQTHYLLRTQFLNEVEESLYGMLKRDRCIRHPDLDYSIFVRQVQGRRLIDAIFKRRAKGTKHYDVIARAREAELRYDPTNHQVLVTMKHCQLFTENNSTAGYVQQKVWPVDVPSDFASLKNPRPRAMSYPDLLARRQEKIAEVEQEDMQIAIAVAKLATVSEAGSLPKHLENLRTARFQHQQEIYSLENELSLRPALSLGCLCFVIVGCPVGIWFSRSDYLSAFVTCFLPIVFVYYPLVLCGTNFAKQGRLPAPIALSAANALVMVVAFFLFRRLLKH